MIPPSRYPLVVMALRMAKEEQQDVVPISFDGPGVFLTRTGQLIDTARACLLAVEKECGREQYVVKNLRGFLGIIRLFFLQTRLT